MSNSKDNKTVVVSSLNLAVINTAHDGYRRAGYKLTRGENLLENVDPDKFDLLDGDPRLVVSVIADSDDDAPGRLAGSQVSGDQLNADERLQAAVIDCLLHPENYQTKGGELSIAKFRTTTGITDLALDVVQAAIETEKAKQPGGE